MNSLLLSVLVAAAGAAIPTPVPTPVTPAVPTVAPGYKAPDVRPTRADIVGVTQQPFVGIALNDAIGMALLKNPDLAVSASNTKVAAYQVQEAKGVNDVNFFVEPSIKHDTNAATNAFFGGGPDFQPIVQNYQTLQVGVKGQLSETGTQYNLNLSQSKVDDNTFIDAFNPYYLASLNISITQPLLKNFGMNDAKRQIQLSLVNSDAQQAATAASVSSTIAQIESVYWDLVAAWRNVAIQEDALRTSVLQQQSNVRLAKHGAAAPIDAVESSTQVAIYQQNVFTALQNVSSLQNELKSMIVTRSGRPDLAREPRADLEPLAAPRIALARGGPRDGRAEPPGSASGPRCAEAGERESRVRKESEAAASGSPASVQRQRFRG